jgi:hypothetical protein
LGQGAEEKLAREKQKATARAAAAKMPPPGRLGQAQAILSGFTFRFPALQPDQAALLFEANLQCLER